MQQTEKSDFWKITLEERTKHDNSFNQLNPLSGFLTGEQAREFFLKSNLPTLVLGQIWNLADLNKDGKLDKREFSIACSLIKKVLTNGEKILPATLPPTMLIDPTVNTSLGSSTPLTTPIQPLFPASFPAANLSSTSSNSMSSSNILPSLFPTTTTTSAPSLAGGGIRMPMTSSVPAASTSTSNLGSIPGTLNMPLFNTTPAFPLLPVTPIAPITSPTQIVSNTTTTPLVGVMPSMMPTSAPPLVAAGSVAPKVNPTLIPGAVVTPIASLNNSPLFPISSTSRTKYTQMFQTNDQTLSGFVSGQQAKTILLQTGLAQTVLAQVWNLADFDKDGKLTLEEFIIAMHLCDYSKSVGNILPSVLPVELHPQRIRAASTTNMLTTSSNGASLLASTSLPATPTPLSAENSSIDTSPTSLAKPQASLATTFEEKRRDNFNRGNQVLEAKRQMLRDAEEREKREREEKERLEQERKQKLKEEQERKRLAEIEKQMERQRLLDMQREEERRKAFEQREQARNELLRQQRIEWERQKKQELELQKLKLQEQLSTLKAKDKNLEYDMQTLNEKIASYKTKINDNQQTLNELNNRLDATRKSYLLKQSEVEIKEKELKEYTQNMSRFSQEKLYLSEQQNGLKIDNPFAEEYRNDMAALKSKQALVSQLKTDLERMESQINTTRTQLEMFKHELEVNKADEREIIKENSRLETLLDLKRGTVMPPNGTNGINHKNSFNKSDSVSNISAMQNGTTHHQAFKTSLSSNNIRSNTPMNNYDVFKSEIEKIQKSTQQLNGANTIKPFDSPSKQQQVSFDPFSSGNNNTKTNAGFGDDWAAFDTNTNTSNGFGSDPFAAFGAGTASVDPFASTSSVTKSLSVNGFGTSDNWAASFTTANDNNSNFNAAPAANLTNSPSSNSITNTVNNNNVAFTNTNENNNWNAFDDAPFGGVQSVHQSPMSSPSSTGMKPLNQLTKYRAEFQFDATRDDELSIKPGDLITVDATFKTDEGWLWGECQGRTGVFPAGFAVKMNDLTSIQEEIHHDFATNAFANNFFPPQTTLQQQPPQPVQQHQPVQKMISSGSSHSFNQTPVQTTTNQISNIKNYYISLYSYTSNEPGDLMFKEFEIINVIDKNEDWLTGQIVGSGSGPGNPLRTGIFPSNFVIKFNFPIEYIGKYTIAMATEVYQAQTGDQLTLNPSDSQLIAIKKLSPDQKWSYGESYDFNGKLVKGWFPVQSAMPLIDAGAVPLYVPPSSGPNTPSGSVTTPTNSESSSSSSPPPPTFSAHNKANNTTSLLAEDPFASSASNINIVLPTTSIINSKSALNDKQLIVESNVNTNSINSNASSSTKPSSANSQSASANTNSGSAASTPTGLTKTVSNTQIKQKHQAASSTLSSSTTSTPSNTAASAAVASSTAASNAATSTQAAPTNTETASAASPAQAPVTNPKIPNNYVDQVIALYDFQSTTPETIGFQKDSIINIIEKSGDWWLGELNGKIGLLPYNYVQSLSKGNG